MYTFKEVYGFKTKLKLLNDYLERHKNDDQKELFDKMPFIDKLDVPILPETRELWLYASLNTIEDTTIECKLVHVDNIDFTIGLYDYDYDSIHFVTVEHKDYLINDEKEIEFNQDRPQKYQALRAVY